MGSAIAEGSRAMVKGCLSVARVRVFLFSYESNLKVIESPAVLCIESFMIFKL